MKKLFLTLLTLIAILAMPATAVTPVEHNGQLKVNVSTGKMVNKNNYPIQLRGMSSHGVQWFPEFLNPTAFTALRDNWGADIVRLSMYIQEGGYASDPAGFTAKMDNWINQVTAAGLYVLIDFHQLNPSDPNDNIEYAKTFFEHMAKTHNSKNNIFYEICNEPNNETETVTWSMIKSYANTIIPIIRQYDTHNIIVVGTAEWDQRPDQVIGNKVSDPLGGDNVLYTVHFYAGSHGSWELDYVKKAVAAKIPVIVTECGTQLATGDGANNFTQSEMWFDYLDQNKISWVNWNFSNDSRTGAVFNKANSVSKTYYESDANLKEAGLWIKNRMKTADDWGASTPSKIVTASATLGGTITPSGAVYVEIGKSQLFTIAAQAGFKIADVKVNGVSKGAITSYTMNNVQGDSTISASFTATANRELLTNGSFTTNIAPWAYQAYGTATGSGTISSNTLKLTTTKIGKEQWEQTVVQTPITLTQGKLYRFSFDAKGTGTKSIEAGVMKVDSPWTVYSSRSEIPGTAFTTYTSYFKMTEPTDTGASVQLQSALHTGSVYFDNVSLKEMVDSAIVFTSQMGDASYNAGQTIPLTWSSTADIATVGLYYSADSGKTWNTITASTANTGSYSFTAPSINSTNVVFKVVPTAYSSVFDLTDWPVTIKSATTTYTISGTINGNGTISPALPVNVNSGASQQLTFTPTSGNQIDSVKVNNAKVTLTNSAYTIPTITANQNVVAWFSPIPDTQKPTITGMPTNISVTISAGKADTTITWIEPKATDNVGTPTLTATHASGSAFKAGTTTVTYTATDAAGNVATASFTVTVKSAADTQKPTITGMPTNISVTISAGKADTTITWIEPKATDNVGTPTLTATHTSGSAFKVGTTTVTYTATDAAGNVATASFIVTVTNAADTQKPTITGMPTNISVTISAGKADTAITWIEPKATDNVGTPTLTATHTSGSTFKVGTTTVTYTATDAAGNVATASFTVTVKSAADTQKPTITGMPTNSSVTISAGKADTTITWIEPKATDNVGTPTLTATHASGSAFKVGTTTVTYTATDAAGNVATASFTVTVTNAADTQKPTITGMPTNSSVTISAGKADTIITWIEPKATDNVGTPTLTATHASGSTFKVGTTTVTYTAKDAAGNTTTASFTVTVTNAADTQKPTITGMPTNISVTISAGKADTTITWIEPKATDNVGTPTLTATHTSGSAFKVGITTVTYTATDAAGNSATASFTVTITVESPKKPVITAVKTFTTNEDEPVTITLDDITVESSSPVVLNILAGENYRSEQGVITPKADFYGTITVGVTVSNAEGTSEPALIQIAVVSVNDAPRSTLPESMIIGERDPISISLYNYFSDESKTILFSANPLPDGLTLENGMLTGKLTPGLYPIEIIAEDSEGLSTASTIAITVEKAMAIDKSETVVKAINAGIQAVPTVVTAADREAHLVISEELSGNATICIYDVVGNIVDRVDLTIFNGGHYLWDLTNESGSPVANGTYIATLDLTQRDGSHKRFRSMIGIRK